MKPYAVHDESELYTNFAAEFSLLTDLLEHTGHPFKLGDTAETKRVFLSFDLARQRVILQSVRDLKQDTLNILENVENKKSSLQMVWWAMNRRGLVPSSATFAGIQDNDIIEIYNLQHQQLFRSFNFLSLIAYTINDLLLFHWMELYSREQHINELLFQKLTQLLSGQIDEVTEGVPDHWVYEIRSSKEHPERVRFVKGAALRDKQGRVAGYLHAFRILT